ncbi:unnamed protein product [Arabis nemorensis]|uniref:Uncharacterized protein n=1 Tax=Arabis nemorensis TaxID=586526 RepID=A0A565CF94_9BRAS|nr:unnamed protein product [Arabis nemorensis]
MWISTRGAAEQGHLSSEDVFGNVVTFVTRSSSRVSRWFGPARRMASRHDTEKTTVPRGGCDELGFERRCRI